MSAGRFHLAQRRKTQEPPRSQPLAFNPAPLALPPNGQQTPEDFLPPGIHETLALLASLKIPFRLLTHAPVSTIDDCLALPEIDGTGTIVPRNALLGPAQAMRSKTFAADPHAYLAAHPDLRFTLMLLMPKKPMRTADVSRALGTSRLSFAPQALLPALLGLSAGAVSPLGMPNDRDGRVTLAIDDELRRAPVWAMHPCDNTATVLIAQADFLNRFLPAIGRTPTWITTSPDEPEKEA